MAAKSGQYAALFESSGSSTLAEGEAMTQVGSTAEFYITDRTKSWWDTADGKTPIFYLDATPIDADDISEIDYAAGYVTLRSYTSGTVTCDVYWFEPAAIGGGYSFDATPTMDTKEITCFPTTLNDPVVWRSYITTLRDWKGKIGRHFFTGRASVTMNCTNPYSDLMWTLKEWGRPGNLRSVEYIVGTDATLQVAYNAGNNKFTVTVGTTETTPTSTAKDIKDHVEADPVLDALLELDYTEDAVAASKTVDCTAAHSDLTWTWRVPGVIGNDEDIEYLVSGLNTPLTITYGSHKISVHVATNGAGTATSTAAQVAACARATSAINAIVSVANATDNNGTGVVNAKSAADFTGGVDAGSGIVEAKTAALMTGGRDQGTDFADIGAKKLMRFYLNTTTGSLEIISGLCILVGVPINVQLDAIQEADLDLQGFGRLKYHTN
jgi:hypothetical protein